MLCTKRMALMRILHCTNLKNALYSKRQNGATKNGSERRQRKKEVRQMNIRKSYNNWREFRKTVTELNALNTRELSDLGINRSDIHSIARTAIKEL
jgi:uncharacterized protein YjiS (DUF1127 family)